MELTLNVVGAAGSRECHALRSWLLRERELRATALVSPGGPVGLGYMGAGELEILNVVLSNAIALGSLVTAVASWRASRPSRPSVRIEANGVAVTVDTDDPETLRALVQAVRDAEHG